MNDMATMNETKTPLKPAVRQYSNQAIAIAKSWGWAIAPAQVLEIAEQSIRLREMRSGEALLELELLSAEELDNILDTKPAETKLLEYAATALPALRPSIEKVLALRGGYAYYPSLNLLTPHPAMNDARVHHKCEELDAVIMHIGGQRSVIVFSSYQVMFNYVSAGREARMADVIRKELTRGREGEDILVAVGRRDEVVSMLSGAKTADGAEAVQLESTWAGTDATDKYQRLLARMLDYVVASRVSDIAIKPFRGGGSQNLMREFGDLVDIPVARVFKPDEYRMIVNFLLARSNANPNATRIFAPKDGQLTYRSQSKGDVHLRLSFIPLNHPGESEQLLSVSIRLLEETDETIDLSNLRLDPRARDALSIASRMSEGLVLLIGATNTGKSTTLAGCVGENYKAFGSSAKRISLENPVERFLPIEMLTQVNVSDHNFEEYLRAILRHDPDMIWIGEIRDRITAEVGVKASITGHLVFSGLHANSTLMGYDKLSKTVSDDMRFQLIESLSCLVQQKLVSEVCPNCGTRHKPTDEEVTFFKAHLKRYGLSGEVPSEVVHRNLQGCDYEKDGVKCKGGRIGMLPVNEVMTVTKEIRDAMHAMLAGENRKSYIEERLELTMYDCAMKLVNDGRVELKGIYL